MNMNYDVYQGETLIYSTDAPAHQVVLREGESVTEHGSQTPIEPEAWAILQATSQAQADAPKWPNTAVTKFAFRNRFNQSEKVAIELAALDDPTAPMPQRQAAAALRANQADVAASTFIDLARPDTRTAVQQLEALGLLSSGRAAEILDAPIQSSERPL